MANEILKKHNIKLICNKEEDGLLLVDVLAKHSNFSKSLIKKLMDNGSVFQTFKGVRKQVRKARNTIKMDDMVECYYDPSIDFDKNFEFELIFETKNYGIYHKPAGAPTEGTNYGDKTSLVRHVEKLKRYVFLVNRMDRETEGLVVVAYNSKTQNLLQQIWRDGAVKKYQAIVLGELTGSGIFEDQINNKPAKTTYRCVKTIENHTYVDIELATERKNQIRIHFLNNGNPVLGDPIYGKGNKNSEGLKLISYSIEFIDPHNNKPVKAELPKHKLLY